MSNTSVDYDIGIVNGYIWFSTPTETEPCGYRWYSGTSRILEVSSKVMGGGGRIRVIPTSDLGESSIGFYTYTDMRMVSAGDVWICGVNSWGAIGYSIGTHGLGNCFNIRPNADVYLKTQLFVNNINILDSLNLKAAASGVYSKTDIDTRFTASNTSISAKLHATTPSASYIAIRNASNEVIMSFSDSKNCRCGGNLTVDTSINAATINVNDIHAISDSLITLHDNVLIGGALEVVDGQVNGIHVNNFHVAGKVNGITLEILSSSGRHPFSITRPVGYSVGVYYISFGTDQNSKPFTNAHYVINLTNIGASNCKVWEIETPTMYGFYIISYNNSSTAVNSTFYFSVIGG